MRGCPQRRHVFRHLNRRQTFGLIQKSNQRMQKWDCSSGPTGLAGSGLRGWSRSTSRPAALRGACASAAPPAPRPLCARAVPSHRPRFSQPVREAEGGRSLVSPRVFCAFSESSQGQFFQDSIIKTIGYNRLVQQGEEG